MAAAECRSITDTTVVYKFTTVVLWVPRNSDTLVITTQQQIRLDWEPAELTDPLAGFEGPTSKRREGKGGEGKPHYNVKEKGKRKGGEGKDRKGDGWDGG